MLQVLTGSLAFAAADPSVPPGVPVDDPVLVGAGGIASCDTPGDEATAALLDEIPGTVFTAGDNAYEHGTAAQFAQCYDKTWGRFKARTHPAPGNHDYSTAAGNPYYSYFGTAAGSAGQGWYSYDLGAWHVVVLNSNCPGSMGCAAGSAQEQWLKADLAGSAAPCTAAVIHHPRFSSDNIDGSQSQVGPLWNDLYAAGADLVISGHARVYERSAAQDPSGKADPDHGLVQINVGTGGRGHAGFVTPVANSVVRDGASWGVLKLTLHPDSYDFAFVPIAGATFADSGSGSCHDKPTAGGGDPGGGGPGGGGPGGGGPPPPTSTYSFGPGADASVVKTKPKANYGKGTSLTADAGPATGTYLRFNVAGLVGTVTRARLRLWVTNGSGNGPAVYPTALGLAPAAPPWPESAITWNRRPARTGPALADLGSVSAQRFVDLDVTAAVTGDGSYGFELASGSADGTVFASREA
ncbi:MAG TPA: DNRLRE domain-containing protein, partial [Acidimicrobiia bacterium]|nr:DNRLRE domain-containing protein [Acidimicrobiia bacterium]